MEKSPEAFRTISEVADWLGVPTHVLRFWESRFSQIKPVKRAGGRRYYRPTDMALIGGIKRLLHDDGMTIRGAQKLLRDKGVRHVASLSQPLDGVPVEDEDVIEATAVDVSASEAPAPAPEPAAPESEPGLFETVEPDRPAPAEDTAAPGLPDLPEAAASDPDDDDDAYSDAPGLAARLRLADRAHLAARAEALRTALGLVGAGSGR